MTLCKTLHEPIKKILGLQSANKGRDLIYIAHRPKRGNGAHNLIDLYRGLDVILHIFGPKKVKIKHKPEYNAIHTFVYISLTLLHTIIIGVLR